MTGFPTTNDFWTRHGVETQNAAGQGSMTLTPIFLPEEEGARLDDAALAGVDIALLSGDMFGSGIIRGFFAAVQGAPNLQWMHVYNAGVDNPVFTRVRDAGARLTTSSGSTAVPIAQTLIAGLLILARGFTSYLPAQREHAWTRLSAPHTPTDLSEQTLTVLGLGAIGAETARLGQALGLHVIGVRRSSLREGDPVDELVHPSELAAVLPRSDWLALCCPLTDETRGIISESAIASLPAGARILNIARGAVVDEPAMVAALQSGHLGGAYLDVFATEPLPPDSPLWDMPNVVITPHASSSASGNDARACGYFLRNLAAFAKGEPMENEVP